MQLVLNQKHTNISDIQNWLWPFFISSFYVLLFQIFSVDIFQIILSLAFVAFLLISNVNTAFISIVFILCGNELFNIGSTSIIIIFVALYALKSLTKRLISKNDKIDLGFVFLNFLLIVLNGIQFFFGNSAQLLTTIKSILFFIFIFDVIKENLNQREELFCSTFRILAFGINYIGFLSILINGVSNINNRYTFSEEITINTLGILCSLSVVNLLFILIYLNSKHRFFDITMILGCTLWGLLTQSKTFLLCVTIGTIIMVFFSTSWNTRIKAAFILLLAILSVFTVISIIPSLNLLFHNAINRFLEPAGDDLSNGRYDLWSQYISNMISNKNFLFFGAGDYTIIGASLNNEIKIAHNFLIEDWVTYGAVGLLLVTMTYVIFIKNYIGPKREALKLKNFIPSLLFISVLIYSHSFLGTARSILFIISFLPLSFDLKNGAKTNENNSNY